MNAPTNGNGATNSRSGAVAAISDRLIRVLPPAFTLLVILNIVFMGVTVYVVTHSADTRNALLTKIIDKCLLDTK